MTLQLNGQFTLEDLRAVRKLDQLRPVFLLVGESEKIVVKRDSTANAQDPRNLRYAHRNMKAVDGTMASRQLTPHELDALEQFVELKKVENGLLNIPLQPDVVSLSQEITNTGPDTWMKTNFFEGLINLEGAAAQARNEGDKSGVRAIVEALSAPGGLEKLGQILAVDAFNGNDDRFDFGDLPVPAKPCYRRLANVGNVAICLQSGVLRPVGMDAYSGRAEFRSLADHARPDPRWSGYRLKDDQMLWRLQFSEDVAADIETALRPENRRKLFPPKQKLPHNAAERIAYGMDEGIATLKRKLLAMSAPNQRPPGLSARMIALGWAVQARGGMQPAPPSGPRPF